MHRGSSNGRPVCNPVKSNLWEIKLWQVYPIQYIVTSNAGVYTNLRWLIYWCIHSPALNYFYRILVKMIYSWWRYLLHSLSVYNTSLHHWLYRGWRCNWRLKHYHVIWLTKYTIQKSSRLLSLDCWRLNLSTTWCSTVSIIVYN